MTNFKEDISRIKAFVFDIDGVLSSQTVTLSSEGEPIRTANLRDGFALQLAVKMGYKIDIISGAHNQYLRVRFEGLGITDIYLGASEKTAAYHDFITKNNLSSDVVLYMGDDIPDYEVMQMCGLPCCPADAAHEIKELSKYISPINGGDGCGRDVIEQIMAAQGKWMDEANAFGW